VLRAPQATHWRARLGWREIWTNAAEALLAAGVLALIALFIGMLRDDPGKATTTAIPTSTLTQMPAPSATATRTATSTPPPGFTPITRNAEWTPIEQDFAGATMVLVPVGCFTKGSNTVDSDENLPYTQCFDAPFWIDKYEVTQGQFAQFGGQAAQNSYFAGDNCPRENITWFEARDFCALRGARLPTEREWEYAARGPDNLVYPWGNTFVADNVVYSGNSNSQTANVGSKPGGASWVGALDMSGNVWEWVSSWYTSYPYDESDGRESETNNGYTYRVLRGRSWYLNGLFVRAAFRYGYIPGFGNSFAGLRCVRSY
jgi:formylglycine-generating enzyme required for sulfatase activity